MPDSESSNLCTPKTATIILYYFIWITCFSSILKAFITMLSEQMAPKCEILWKLASFDRTLQNFWVEPHPLLKHGWFQWYFRTLAGHFEALLQTLRLIWEDEATSIKSNWSNILMIPYDVIIPTVGVVFICFCCCGWKSYRTTIVIGWCLCLQCKSSEKLSLIQKIKGLLFTMWYLSEVWIFFLCKLIMSPVCKGLNAH